MHTVELIGNDKKERKYTLPSAWDECSVAQLGAIAAITSVTVPMGLDAGQAEQMEAHLRLQLFHHLLGMTDAEFAAIDVGDLLSVKYDDLGVAHVALLPWVDWCLAEPLFHQSLVPHVTVKGVLYEGPRNMLSRWPVAQWIFADANLRMLADTGDAKHLDNLLGCLYAPANAQWHNDDIETYGAALSALDDRTKLAAVLNYRGLRGWLAAKYWRAFKGGKEDPHGPEGMVVRLAGPKFGDVEEVWYKPLSSVMVHVEQSLLEQEETERNRQK
jgi:hypothetical protein